jgi:hypothetical protein
VLLGNLWLPGIIDAEEAEMLAHDLIVVRSSVGELGRSPLAPIEDSGDSVSWLRVCLDLPAASRNCRVKPSTLRRGA